jgi:hypothetical protein
MAVMVSELAEFGDGGNSPDDDLRRASLSVTGKAHPSAKLHLPRAAQAIYSLPASILRRCETTLNG